METPTTEPVGVFGLYEKPEELPTIDSLVRRHLLNTLEAFSGNKTKTAKQLGISLKTLYNKLHEYGYMEQVAETAKVEADKAFGNPHHGHHETAAPTKTPKAPKTGDTTKLTKFFDV